MRRAALLALVVMVAAAACGDDDAGDGTTTTTTAPASSTTAAPTTTAASTTSTEETTTTEAATTTEATNAALQAALELQGTYEGAWNNTTFGSTGPISVTIDVDETAQFAIITLDLGGNVFGGFDPDPIVYEADLVADPDTFEQSDELFGESTATFGPGGEFTLVAPMVPGVGGLTLTIEGEVGPGGFTGTYVITDLADGTFEAIPSN